MGTLATLLRRIVGSRDADADQADSDKEVEYNGYAIRPASEKQGAQWRTAGVITKTFEDGVKTQRFVRADVYNTRDDADDCAILKGKRIIDEQGDALFRDD